MLSKFRCFFVFNPILFRRKKIHSVKANLNPNRNKMEIINSRVQFCIKPCHIYYLCGNGDGGGDVASVVDGCGCCWQIISNYKFLFVCVCVREMIFFLPISQMLRIQRLRFVIFVLHHHHHHFFAIVFWSFICLFISVYFMSNVYSNLVCLSRCFVIQNTHTQTHTHQAHKHHYFVNQLQPGFILIQAFEL